MGTHFTKRHTANAPTMIWLLYRNLQRSRAHGKQPHTHSIQVFDTARASLRAPPDTETSNTRNI